MSALFLIGLFCIIKGGDAFVDAASFMAERTGISPVIMGATVVSFATTMPELLVSLLATTRGSVDMAVGNSIGSIACNTGIVLALCLAICPPILKKSEIRSKGVHLLLAMFLLGASIKNLRLTTLESLLLISMFILFVYINIQSASSQTKKHKKCLSQEPIGSQIIKFILGAGAILVGAELMVDNGALIAEWMGIPERIIALTLIALGTSLPELVTAIAAISKKKAELCIGNIIGANILNVSMILSSCSLLSGGKIRIPEHTVGFDFPVAMGLTLLAIVPALKTGKFRKWQGFSMLGIYGVYVIMICKGI